MVVVQKWLTTSVQVGAYKVDGGFILIIEVGARVSLVFTLFARSCFRLVSFNCNGLHFLCICLWVSFSCCYLHRIAKLSNPIDEVDNTLNNKCKTPPYTPPT